MRKLKQAGRRYGLVLLDPPAFARSKQAVSRALAGYKDVNLHGIRLTSPEVAGIALVAWGLFGLPGVGGIVVAIIGLVPLIAGIFHFCDFAPLFGAPLSGPKIRAGK